ncbi:MAG TPA: type IV pilus secretin PilQ [Aquabacterium sp.]|uniref:type IV pilus secretin PilQ n=1 Tax=Aquabacterium sp. TaxID=1872578 RepID=UPI002E372660|nr:type IV pilus secretin PilQ [Aquabacterium sp.]HEX5354934.1 type IV pilus secretin PilQ [Aquabacterium sp.]
MKPWRVALAGLTLALVSPLTWAAAAIQAITSTQQAGSDVIRIDLSEPLATVPAGFVVQTPPRVAIDLPGVSNGLARNSVEINQGNVRSVNVVQAGERTRLVLNLRQSTTYRAQLEGKSLLLILDSGANQPAPAPVAANSAAASTGAGKAPAKADDTVRFAENKNVSPLALKDIDFRRGQDGAGRVVVELPNNQVGVDIKQQGQSLVVEFVRASLPERLRRRFDVMDFGTPVQSVSASQVGERVKLVVDPKGDWEHSAYQSDNQFVLEVRPRKVDPNKLTQGPGYSGEKLSLNFQNIEVRALLQVIADFTNFNVVTSDTVTGNVTLRLKDVPWDQALDIIMQAKGLGVRKSGNVLWIAPKDEINAKEKIDLEAKAQVAALEPLRTQSFQLNYTKAEEIAKGLTGTNSGGSGGGGGTAARILSPRGSVIFETRTNQLFVNDIPSKLEEIQQMITKIDIPVRQVLIEARIVEASDTFGRSLGVRLGALDMRGLRSGTPGFSVGGDNRVAITGTYQGVGEQTLQAAATSGSYTPNSYFVNLPSGGFNGYTASSVALSLFGASANRFLNLELSALESDGKGKIVSSPRVITADQVKALIEQGTELPYQTATSSGATAIAFRKANLKLEVTPQITPEGSIILDVDVNKDSVGQVTNAGYAIDTKHVQTQVLVENGGTVVIGGIFLQSENSTDTKVPFLGDIPVLGHLFKSNTKRADRSELLIFLTPKVVTEKTGMR